MTILCYSIRSVQYFTRAYHVPYICTYIYCLQDFNFLRPLQNRLYNSLLPSTHVHLVHLGFSTIMFIIKYSTPQCFVFSILQLRLSLKTKQSPHLSVFYRPQTLFFRQRKGSGLTCTENRKCSQFYSQLAVTMKRDAELKGGYLNTEQYAEQNNTEEYKWSR